MGVLHNSQQHSLTLNCFTASMPRASRRQPGRQSRGASARGAARAAHEPSNSMTPRISRSSASRAASMPSTSMISTRWLLTVRVASTSGWLSTCRAAAASAAAGARAGLKPRRTHRALCAALGRSAAASTFCRRFRLERPAAVRTAPRQRARPPRARAGRVRAGRAGRAPRAG